MPKRSLAARWRWDGEIRKNFTPGTQCLSYNLLLKQSRHYYLTLELLECWSPLKHFITASWQLFHILVKQMLLLPACKWKRYCSFLFVIREWKSFECRLCVLCKFQSCLLLFIYFTPLPVSERLCTAISSLEFRFHYSCRLTWESFQKTLRVGEGIYGEISAFFVDLFCLLEQNKVVSLTWY